MTFEEYVEFRLQEWADWFRGGQLGKGYPAESSIALVSKDMTINRSKYENHNFLPVNESAEEIEKIIVELSEYNKMYAEALKKYYLGKRVTLQIKAKELNLSETTFKKYFTMGRLWVCAKLSAFKV